MDVNLRSGKLLSAQYAENMSIILRNGIATRLSVRLCRWRGKSNRAEFECGTERRIPSNDVGPVRMSSVFLPAVSHPCVPDGISTDLIALKRWPLQHLWTRFGGQGGILHQKLFVVVLQRLFRRFPLACVPGRCTTSPTPHSNFATGHLVVRKWPEGPRSFNPNPMTPCHGPNQGPPLDVNRG